MEMRGSWMCGMSEWTRDESKKMRVAEHAALDCVRKKFVLFLHDQKKEARETQQVCWMWEKIVFGKWEREKSCKKWWKFLPWIILYGASGFDPVISRLCFILTKLNLCAGQANSSTCCSSEFFYSLRLFFSNFSSRRSNSVHVGGFWNF